MVLQYKENYLRIQNVKKIIIKKSILILSDSWNIWKHLKQLKSNIPKGKLKQTELIIKISILKRY